MKGRPPKKTISIRWDESRERFRVTIPPALTGSRKVERFFPTRERAEIWASERGVEVAKTGTLNARAIDDADRQTVSAAISAYLRDRKSEVSKEQAKLLQNHLGKLAGKFGALEPDDVNPLTCRNWLRCLPMAQRTRHGIYSSCRTFYRWAMRYGLATTSPFDRMEPIPKGESPKAILSIREIKALLGLEMDGYMRDWLILGIFCGLRPAEIFRLDWSAVDFRSREIHIAPHVIKRDALRSRGMRERYVEIPEAAMRLLPRGKKGDIVPVGKTTFLLRLSKLSASLKKSSWPHDCCRHSAATYMLALKNDAAYVAHWLGHTTTRMVFENYARAVPKADAVAWAAIGLRNGDKVTSISVAA